MLIDQPNPYAAGAPGALKLGWDDFRFELSARNRAALGRRARWTVLAYLAADCDLARWMFDDLLDMKAVGSDDDVHLIAAFDGPLLADAFVARLNAGTPLGEDLVMRWRELNMSDPRLLTQLMMLAQAYPAERRLVILAGHGMGWRGALLDENRGRAYLEPGRLVLPAPGKDCDAELRRCQQAAQDEINAAIEAQHVEGAPPWDVLAFDACYMSNLETVATLGPHARYLVVSEDQWPGEGFDYRSLLRTLRDDPAIEPEELVKRWVAQSRSYYVRNADRKSPVTLAAIDAARLPALVEAIVRFAQTLDPKDAALNRALHDALGAAWHDRSTGVVDIKGLALQLLARPLPHTCAAATRVLVERFDDALIGFCGGGTASSTHGLSIYAPPPEKFDPEYIRLANRLPHGLGVWAWMLGGYCLQTLGTRQPDHPLLTALRSTMKAAVEAGHWSPPRTEH
jgi:hypothetical protein